MINSQEIIKDNLKLKLTKLLLQIYFKITIYYKR